MNIGIAHLIRCHCWISFGQFDAVVYEFAFEAMYFHGSSFSDLEDSELSNIDVRIVETRVAAGLFFFRVRRIAANQLRPYGFQSEHPVLTESLYVPDALALLKE